MKNPEIELVKKWLADPNSVSSEERDQALANAIRIAAKTADAVYRAAYRADVDAATAVNDAETADGIAAAVSYAVDAARANNAYAAKRWVERYEELTQ